MAVRNPGPPPMVAPPGWAGRTAYTAESQLAQSREAAGWGLRLSAWLIDWTILILPLSVIGTLLSGPLGDPNGDGIGLLVGIVLLPIAFVYFALLNGRGQTLGKRLLGIRVVDAQTWGPIGGRKGAIRELVRVGLGSVSFGWGFLVDGVWPLWDERDQSLHDKAAHSVVVRDAPKPALPVAITVEPAKATETTTREGGRTSSDAVAHSSRTRRTLVAVSGGVAAGAIWILGAIAYMAYAITRGGMCGLLEHDAVPGHPSGWGEPSTSGLVLVGLLLWIAVGGYALWRPGRTGKALVWFSAIYGACLIAIAVVAPLLGDPARCRPDKFPVF